MAARIIVMTKGIGSIFNILAKDIPKGINKAALALFVKKLVITATTKNNTDITEIRIF